MYIPLSTKSYTYENLRSQNFPFPSGVIYYITTFPSSIGGQQKLQKTCKYFYGKNQILVFNSLKWSKDDAKWITKKDFIIETEKVSYKIWLYKCLIIEGMINKNVVGFLIEKVYRCDIYSLTIKDQNMSFTEYKFLTNSAKIELLRFENVTIKYSNNDDAEIVPFENILEQLPNLVGLTCVYRNNLEQHFTLKTAQNLVKLPIFKLLKVCIIQGIPELLNIEYLCDFVKKHEANYLLHFPTTVSNGYKKEFVSVLAKNSIMHQMFRNRLRILTNQKCLSAKFFDS